MTCVYLKGLNIQQDEKNEHVFDQDSHAYVGHIKVCKEEWQWQAQIRAPEEAELFNINKRRQHRRMSMEGKDLTSD